MTYLNPVNLGTVHGNYTWAGMIVRSTDAINNAGQIVGMTYQGGNGSYGFLWQSGKMTDLGSLGGNETEAEAINNSGQVVGDSTTSNGINHAFIWQNGKMIDLGTLGGVNRSNSPDPNYGDAAGATAINSAGQVIGWSYVNSSNEHAFIWQNGKMTDLGTQSGFANSIAEAVNDSGQVAGNLTTNSGIFPGAEHAFIWQSGHMTDLGTLGGATSSVVAIDNAGQVIGNSTTSTGVTHAFIWQSGHMTDLGSLPGFTNSVATAMNSSGQVVGNTSAGAARHAFIWQNANMTDLGTLPGFTGSVAAAINSSGEVVGYLTTGTGATDAFVWQNGKMIDLNTLLPANSGWILADARGINDSGQVSGWGILNGQSAEFELTLPTPSVTHQTAAQTWQPGQKVSFALPSNTFTDSLGQTLTYSAVQSNGQALPSWLSFNAATDTFSGSVPGGAQSLNLKVTATDTSGLSASETFAVTVPAPLLTTLISFNGINGSDAIGGVVADAAGDLFGTTYRGGANSQGTVFELLKTSTGYASTPITLLSFNGTNGANPISRLFIDATGNLFGTTYLGGAKGDGTVFEIAKTSTGYANGPTTLVSFNGTNGSTPETALIADATGNLFGTTSSGGKNGCGTVFEIAKTSTGYANAPTTLVNFNGTNGSIPEGLITDAAGNLFGTTAYGGVNGSGTVFEIAKTSTGYASALTTLVNFNGTNGATPEAGLIADAAGNLFGTTAYGGVNWGGTVFEIAKTSTGYANSPTTLASFNFANGSSPETGIFIDAAGNLFGTTSFGGANGRGTVFEIAKTSTGYASAPTTLVGFNGTNGSAPDGGLIADAAGNFFGMTMGDGTHNQGTVFELSNSGAAVSIPGVTLINLGNLGKSGVIPYGTYAFGLNEFGQIVGNTATSSGSSPAFLWQNGVMTNLGTLSGSYSAGLAINNAGQIVGESGTSSGSDHAFLWQGGKITDLGTLGGANSVAHGINNLGQIVGEANTGTGTDHAFLWQGGKITDLGTLGGANSMAFGVNSLGQIVGTANTSSGTNHAFLWQNGKMADLGTLGGTYSGADGINSLGQIVGDADTSSGSEHAFLWQNGKMTDLGTLGGTYSGATAINQGGQIVGDSSVSSGQEHAFLWQNGTMTDLNSFLPTGSGWVLQYATGIDNSAQIVGWGTYNGALAAFELTMPLLSPQTALSQGANSNFYNLNLVDPSTIQSGGIFSASGAVDLSQNQITLFSQQAACTVELSSYFHLAYIANSGDTIYDGPGSNNIYITGSNNVVTVGNGSSDTLELDKGSNTIIHGFTPAKGSVLEVSGALNEASVTLLNGTVNPIHGSSLNFGSTSSGKAYVINIGNIGAGTAAQVASAANAAYLVADVNGNTATGTLGENVTFIGTNSSGDAEIWAFKAPLSTITLNGQSEQVPITGADTSNAHHVTAGEITLIATLIGVTAANLTTADLA